MVFLYHAPARTGASWQLANHRQEQHVQMPVRRQLPTRARWLRQASQLLAQGSLAPVAIEIPLLSPGYWKDTPRMRTKMKTTMQTIPGVTEQLSTKSQQAPMKSLLRAPTPSPGL